jgi:hypothetical protein
VKLDTLARSIASGQRRPATMSAEKARFWARRQAADQRKHDPILKMERERDARPLKNALDRLKAAHHARTQARALVAKLCREEAEKARASARWYADEAKELAADLKKLRGAAKAALLDARGRCSTAKGEAARGASRGVAEAKRAVVAERSDLRRLRGTRAKAEKRERPRYFETWEESLSNVKPELHAVFRKVGRGLTFDPSKVSRSEKFSEWVAQNPEEVWAIMGEGHDAEVSRAEREYLAEQAEEHAALEAERQAIQAEGKAPRKKRAKPADDIPF